jgi:hypothetical protein
MELPEGIEYVQPLFDSQNVLNSDSVQVPQTANDGKIDHVQFTVLQVTGISETAAAMMPSYTATFVESPRDVSSRMSAEMTAPETKARITPEIARNYIAPSFGSRRRRHRLSVRASLVYEYSRYIRVLDHLRREGFEALNQNRDCSPDAGKMANASEHKRLKQV